MNPPQLDLRHTALVLIDLQKGIVPMPLLPRSGAEVVKNAVLIAGQFHAAKALVVLIRVAFSPDGGDVLKPAVDLSFNRGTPPADWMEIVPELGPQPGDLVITKRQWGAFYGTELDLQLRRRGITKIVLGGIATHIGVESTARAAYELGYEQVLVEDAMSSMSEETHAFPIHHVFPRLGLVRSTAEVMAACSAAGQ